MADSAKKSLAPSLCGGGAFLLFLDRYFEGILAYLFSGVGLVMVIVGLVLLNEG